MRFDNQGNVAFLLTKKVCEDSIKETTDIFQVYILSLTGFGIVCSGKFNRSSLLQLWHEKSIDFTEALH